MKKMGLFLLAVVLMVGVAGCSSDDDKLTAADMAGTYVITSFTKDGTAYAITGSVILTSSGTYSSNTNASGGGSSGTFTVDDPYIYFTETGDTQVQTAVITDDGKTVTVNQTDDGGHADVIVYTKQ